MPVSSHPLPPAGPASDLRVRTISGVAMVALALVTAWAGGQVFILFWLLAGFFVLWEWQRLVDAPALIGRTLAGAAGLAIAAALTAGGLVYLACGVVGFAAIVLAVIAISAGRPDKAAWVAGGMLYAGALVIAVLVLRISLRHGFEAILWLFAIVWGTDILAYFTGRTLGGPKLWRRVSPSKTWSGFIGGVLGGAIAGVVFAVALVSAVRAYPSFVFAFALALAIVSQLGDLFESAIKRHYDVKDSSNLIPGHGGAMDRLDGFTAAAICAAIVGVARAGPVKAASGLFSW